MSWASSLSNVRDHLADQILRLKVGTMISKSPVSGRSRDYSLLDQSIMAKSASNCGLDVDAKSSQIHKYKHNGEWLR